MFKPNDSVYVEYGSSGRVVNYNPYTNDILILHRLSEKSWLQVKYNAEYVKKSTNPLFWDINTPFLTPKPSMLQTIYSYLGFR